MENVKELRIKDLNKLLELLKENYKKLIDLDLRFSMGIEKDFSKKSQIKKQIAKINTVIKEKEILNER